MAIPSDIGTSDFHADMADGWETFAQQVAELTVEWDLLKDHREDLDDQIARRVEELHKLKTQRDEVDSRLAQIKSKQKVLIIHPIIIIQTLISFAIGVHGRSCSDKVSLGEECDNQ